MKEFTYSICKCIDFLWKQVYSGKDIYGKVDPNKDMYIYTSFTLENDYHNSFLFLLQELGNLAVIDLLEYHLSLWKEWIVISINIYYLLRSFIKIRILFFLTLSRKDIIEFIYLGELSDICYYRRKLLNMEEYQKVMNI